MVGTVTKQPEELRQVITQVLKAAGGVEEKARIVADHLTDADQCGVQTHGLLTMPSYLQEIADGKLLPESAPEVISDEGNRATVTGNWGFGQCSADFAVRLAIDKARQHGLALVGLVRCNHIGRLGHYAEMAASAGMISQIFGSGYSMTGARAAAYGGRDRVLDTNPICIGVPSGQRPPFILDFATTHGSGAKVVNAYRRGEQLPLGVIADRDGKPTTNPADFMDGGGTLSSFGGHKGSGIMLAVELLGRVLTGADSHAVEGEGAYLMGHQGVSFIVMRADALSPLTDFRSRVDDTLDRITGSNPADGFDEVLYPGLKEATTRAQCERDGIPIPQDLWDLFAESARTVGGEL